MPTGPRRTRLARTHSRFRGPHLLDDSRELLRLLEGRQMTPRHHADIESLVPQTLPGLHDLVWLEGVTFTAYDVEGDRLVERLKEAAQIPPLRIATLQ